MTTKSRVIAKIVACTVASGLAAAPAALGQESPEPTPLVRIPHPRDERALNPFAADSAYHLVTLIYDTLMWRDAEGTPQPWLAKSAEVSGDGLQVTVRLAEGARWHDGEPVEASDVAFSYLMYARRPHATFTPALRPIRSIETPSPDTVVINLRSPSPGFLHQPLSSVPIVPRHLWEGLPSEKNAPDGLPVGSGPYRLAEHRAGYSYSFEAVPGYFRGTPLVSRIQVFFVGTTEARLQAFEDRELDIVQVSFPERAADRARRAGVRIIDGPSYPGTVLMFNLRKPPFDHPVARHAVAKALDLRRIRRIVGRAAAAEKGYLHPDSEWASEPSLNVFDQAGAREELAGEDLPPLRILTPTNDLSHLEAGEQVALALQRAGADAEMERVSASELSRAVGEDGSEPTFDLAIWASPALASYDPSWLAPLFSGDPEIGTLNYSGYQSNEFERAAGTITSSMDVNQRRAAVAEAIRQISADKPVIPLFFLDGVFAYRPEAYNGWTFVKGSGVLDKRSFTDPRLPTPHRSMGTPTEGEEPSRISFFGVMGGLALGLAVVLALADLMRKRRPAA